MVDPCLTCVVVVVVDQLCLVCLSFRYVTKTFKMDARQNDGSLLLERAWGAKGLKYYLNDVHRLKIEDVFI